ncbi:orf115a (mitochondrion) [Beta vulgaris subsp. vulgaris]|uniref:Orf115a protein n=3 Tax=Beta TaxID=3554 RepID=Q9MFA3_BETVV|nr:orf115a [Beta vulgaris subsp. vulgaris]YP_004222278.1 hypothetical protein LKY74_mgp125 [Beta vulgaris subsp. maritima]YP_004842086.1 hypothetical protein LKY79_mgp122 [Beta macrocarpa]CBJ14100.1 hypothetical protein [Beta vulgaris subsp. maritima]CBJ17509.1 hypothetical protein [Beta vulgaris subsp. maritima]CBJ23358.1 hypothetical protein [Beta vulgaris subsp. maritima]CBL52044.1 hypothetical protein [Beta vulgaris subsp. maritima]CBX24888.1 hypothetical protein [Beta macrocarpa]
MANSSLSKSCLPQFCSQRINSYCLDYDYSILHLGTKEKRLSVQASCPEGTAPYYELQQFLAWASYHHFYIRYAIYSYELVITPQSTRPEGSKQSRLTLNSSPAPIAIESFSFPAG